MAKVSVSNTSNIRALYLFKNLQSVRNQFCDVKIKIDEVVIPAHKCILSASSPFFKNFFSSALLEESDASEVKLTTLDGGRTSAIIEYFYSGILSFNENELMEMYKDVDFLQIFELKAQLFQLIEEKMDTRNCCAIWDLFDYTKSGLEPVTRFICENIDKLLEDPKLLSFAGEKFGSLLESMHKFEGLLTQDSIYRMIMAWASHNIVIRGEELPTLLNFCNLKYLSEDVIQKLSDEIISKDENDFLRKWLLENPFFHCVTSDGKIIFSMQGNGSVRIYYPVSNSVITTPSNSKGEFATGIVISRNVLYVAGGINSHKESSETCDPCDIGSENWSLVRSPFKFSRPQMYSCNGEIFMFYANQSPPNNLATFEIETNSIYVADSDCNVPSKGPDRIMCTDGDFMYAILKESGETVIYRDSDYEDGASEWLPLSTTGDITYQNINELPSTVNIFNNEIFLFSDKTGVLQSYSLKTNSWAQLKNQEHLKDPSTRLISTANQLFAVTLDSVYRFTDGEFEFVRSLM